MWRNRVAYKLGRKKRWLEQCISFGCIACAQQHCGSQSTHTHGSSERTLFTMFFFVFCLSFYYYIVVAVFRLSWHLILWCRLCFLYYYFFLYPHTAIRIYESFVLCTPMQHTITHNCTNIYIHLYITMSSGQIELRTYTLAA